MPIRYRRKEREEKPFLKEMLKWGETKSPEELFKIFSMVVRKIADERKVPERPEWLRMRVRMIRDWGERRLEELILSKPPPIGRRLGLLWRRLRDLSIEREREIEELKRKAKETAEKIWKLETERMRKERDRWKREALEWRRFMRTQRFVMWPKVDLRREIALLPMTFPQYRPWMKVDIAPKGARIEYLGYFNHIPGWCEGGHVWELMLKEGDAVFLYSMLIGRKPKDFKEAMEGIGRFLDRWNPWRRYVTERAQVEGKWRERMIRTWEEIRRMQRIWWEKTFPEVWEVLRKVRREMERLRK